MSTNQNSQPLYDIITDKIKASPQQRLTFADYMDLVLYHPQYGYYASGTAKIGSQGDFLTSPSLSSDFGELLAEQFVLMWDILGKPEPFRSVEMGAGGGLFAADILPYLQQHHPDFFDILEYTIIERAEGLICQQQSLLEKWLDKKAKLCWKTWQEIAENSLVGCCFSNELVDAFPVHQVVIEGGELREVYITLANQKLGETTGELSTFQLREYFNLVGVNLPSENYADGYRTEVNLAALNWLETVSQKLKRGYLLTIDYGYTAQRYYHPQRSQGTLQCYYQHRRHHNPYINLGYQDLTAHVDFTALSHQGELCGLQELGFSKQGIFLMELGLGDRLAALSNSQLNILQVMQRRDVLHQLIDPAGLGGFGVLLQGKGLSEAEQARSRLREY